MSETLERTALYRFYNADEALLYVGVTNDPVRRWDQHADAKEWWPQVARKTIEWFEGRAEALAAERTAIRSENPIHNHQSKSSPALREIAAGRLETMTTGPWRPYELIAHELKGFVQCGPLRAGDRFPTVRELMTAYGVATQTIQRALEMLANQGFAVRRAGFGTVAALPAGRRHEMADAQDADGAIERMFTCRQVPSPHVCAALGVAEGSELDSRSWVRTIDARPVEIVHFHRHPDARADDTVHHTRDRVTAAPPTAETVALFGLVPLLVTLRMAFAESGRPIGLYKIIKNGDLLTTQYDAR